MLSNSSFMSNIVTQISSENKHPASLIDVEIYNENNQYVHIKPFIIDNIKIEQLFLENYIDDITLRAKFLPNDFKIIYDNLEGLKIRLTIKSIDILTGQLYRDIPFIIKEYNAHLINAEDSYKNIQLKKIHTDNPDQAETSEQITTLIPLTFQLFDDFNYRFRKILFNVTFTHTSMTDAILFICKKIGINKVYIEESYINRLIFQNIVIRPDKGTLDTIFNYLQQKYGIYPYGFNYYFYDNVFYLYQPWLVSNLNKFNNQFIRFYRLQPNSFGNIFITYKNINDQLHVLINSPLTTYPINIKEIENEGNLYFFDDSSKYLNNTQITSQDVTYKPTIQSSAVNDNIIRLKSNNIIPKYKKKHPFVISSEIAYKNSEIIEFPWMHAGLFSTIPGQFVKFIYEKNDEIIMQDGRLESIVYDVNRTDQKYTTSSVFDVIGYVRCRLTTNLQKIK